MLFIDQQDYKYINTLIIWVSSFHHFLILCFFIWFWNAYNLFGISVHINFHQIFRFQQFLFWSWEIYVLWSWFFKQWRILTFLWFDPFNSFIFLCWFFIWLLFRFWFRFWLIILISTVYPLSNFLNGHLILFYHISFLFQYFESLRINDNNFFLFNFLNPWNFRLRFLTFNSFYREFIRTVS